MTAKEFHNQITTWVEDHTDGKQSNHTDSPCDDCRTTFERELSARMKISERPTADDLPEVRQLVGSPTATMDDSIGIATPKHGTIPSATAAASKQKTSSPLAMVGMLCSVGLVLAGIFLLLNRKEQPSTTLPIQSPASASSPSSKPLPSLNFFNAAATNFAAIMGGKVKPEMETGSKEELSEFFKEQGVAYPVTFPTTSLTLAGGLVSKHGDASVAHLVYRSGERVMYVFQIPWRLLQQGRPFYVTQDAAQKMEAGEKFLESSGSDQSLSIGKYGELAIAIAANVPKEQMAQLAKW